jgi:hypothetical protein
MTVVTPVGTVAPPTSDSVATATATAVASAVSQSLARRGYLTTGWFTTVIGGGLTVLLGYVGVSGPVAAQVVTVAAPAVLAAAYAVVRTGQKSRLGAIAADLLPQYTQTP